MTPDNKSIADQIRAGRGSVMAESSWWDAWNAAVDSAADIAAAGEAALRADRDRLAADLKVAREALEQITNKPSAMTWGEDYEVLDAMRAMEAIAAAAIASIAGGDNG